MSLLQSIILGVVEGFTEFLPISSTGHLVLISHLLKLNQDDFLKSFEISIQLGAIFSVVVLYFRRFILNLEIIKRIIVAFIPTAVVGFLFYRFIKRVLIGSTDIVLWALLGGGIALIIFEIWYKRKEDSGEINLDKIPFKKCFLVGVFQSISVIPGVSRAAATIIGGLWLGVPRKSIVEFSFLLALPTMAGATGLDLINNFSLFSAEQFGILFAGLASSFVMAVISIKFLLSFVQKHDFIPFGIYRIILAVLFFTVLI